MKYVPEFIGVCGVIAIAVASYKPESKVPTRATAGSVPLSALKTPAVAFDTRSESAVKLVDESAALLADSRHVAEPQGLHEANRWNNSATLYTQPPAEPPAARYVSVPARSGAQANSCGANGCASASSGQRFRPLRRLFGRRRWNL
jgi:hypothetical protein